MKGSLGKHQTLVVASWTRIGDLSLTAYLPSYKRFHALMLSKKPDIY